MFGWRTRKVKTVFYNRQTASKEIIEMPAKEIIDSPSGHQMESLIHALCICVSELTNIQEQSAARIAELQKHLQTGGENASVQDQVSENH